MFSFQGFCYVQHCVAHYVCAGHLRLQVCSEVLVETFEQGDHITAYISDEGNPINHKWVPARVPNGSKHVCVHVYLSEAGRSV